MKFEDLTHEIVNIANTIEGDIALYLDFLNTDYSFNINPIRSFTALSIIKVPLVLSFFNHLDSGEYSLEDRIVLKHENIVKGTGVLHLLNKENSYTVLDLIKLSLAVSDNTAINEIIDIVGREAIAQFFESHNLDNTKFNHKLMLTEGMGPNVTTATDMHQLLLNLFERDFPYSNDVLDLMTEEKDRNILPYYIPSNTKISHKTGLSSNAYHNIGLVFAQTPFIFVLLTENLVNKKNELEKFRSIASMAYEFSNSL